jgi:hypothetical protein
MERNALAATLSSRTFLTFGGIETYLLFVQRYALREFCAFEIVRDEASWKQLEDGLLRPIADAAAANGVGLLTDCLVWRASSDYVTRLGHLDLGVAGMNGLAVARTRRFIDEWRATGAAARECPVILAADLGPRGDGYAAGEAGTVSIETALEYHAPQVDSLAGAGVDLLVALTMTGVNETIGVVRAAERRGLAVLVSPTVETDGKVPDGSTLGDFVTAIDEATSGYPVGYMANCAHPTG